MKFKLLMILIPLLFIDNIHSQNNDFKMFSISPAFSVVFDKDHNIDYFLSLGGELFIFKEYKNKKHFRFFEINKFGVFYSYSMKEENNYLSLGYSIMPPIKPGYADYPLRYLIGINGGYNIDKNIFGIIPEIGVTFFVITSLSYRFNIYFDKVLSNKHEFTLKIGIIPKMFME